MEHLAALISEIRNRIHQISAYIGTLYYLEIIFLMFGILFLYGKAVSIAAGLILTLLLTYHIIQLFLRNRLHRTIQLFLIDVHASFAAGYLFYNVVQGVDTAPTALFILIARSIVLACEIPLLFFLTGEDGAAAFR